MKRAVQKARWNIFEPVDSKDLPPLTEYQECKIFYGWVRNHHILKNYLFHIPNEGKRGKVMGRLMAQIGLISGVPDYMLAYPSGGYHGLFIEMKRSNMKNKKIPENQSIWLERLKKVGYYCTVCYSGYEAIRVVTDYLSESVEHTIPESK